MAHWHASDLLGQEEIERKVPDTVLLKRLSAYVVSFKTQLVTSIIFLFVTAATNLAGPYILKMAIDQYIAAKDLAGLANIVMAYVAINIVNFVSSNRQLYLMSGIGQRIIYRLREEMFSHLQRLSFKFYSENVTGSVVSRLTNDVDSLQELLTSGVLTLLSDVLTIVGIFIIMVWMSPQLTLVSMVITPMLLALIYIFQRKAKSAYLATKQKMAGVTAKLGESIMGMRVIQSFTRESDQQQAFGQANIENLQANLVAARLLAVFPASVEMISAVGTCVVLWYGGLQASAGAITIGTIVAFMSYLTMFFRPLLQLSIFYTNFQSAMAGAERMFEIIDAPIDIEEKHDAIELPALSGKIDFKNVTFGYDPKFPVLNNITLRIASNETMAIVGPTGAGKTTLISLVCRFYDPTVGSIKVDGHDLRELKLQSLHRQIGLVLQEPFLFAGSVKENIRYSRPEASDEKVIEAAKAVGAHDFIERLPKGYDTIVREGATNLSIGQRQLVSFARALLADPRILIMDEATSSVDPYTELLIRRALEKLLKNRTALIIAHRLSTVRNADRIIVLDQGRIVEEGTHDQLIAKKGLYARLYHMQFKESAEEAITQRAQILDH
jgi:ATP-binding cassette subfamily B protein